MAEAVDMQRLVVSMEAKFTTFNKELQKLTGSVEKETRKIETRFKAVNDNLQGQTANLAAQFQDIGVQLASGTSPLTVALQQGTQIAAVLGESRGGAAGAVKALGSAFASVVSPISLATIGIIALGGAAIQYVSGMISDTESLDDRLKTHANLIKQIKEAYGEAAEGLEEYARESTAVLETQTRASIIKLQEDLEKLARTMSRSLVDSPAAAVTNIGTIEVDTNSLDDVEAKYDAFAAAIRRLREEAKNGEPNIRAFREAVAAVAEQNPGDEKIQKLANELLTLSNQAYEVENSLATARRAIGLIGDVASGQVGQIKELSNALSELGRIGMPNLTDREKALEAYQKAIGAAGGAEDRRSAQTAYDAALKRIGEREAEEKAAEAARAAARSSRSRGGGGGSTASERNPYQEELTEIQSATRALELEFEMLGKSNIEREKARTIMEVENALRREGVTLTDAQRAEVGQLAEAYAQMSDKLKAANATQQELQQLASSSLKGFVSDLMNGVDAATALQNALARIGDRLIDIAINSIFDPKSGGGLGNLFSSLLGGFGGARALGGSVQAGKTYLVGENGPELATFGRNGTIIPNHALPRGGSGGGLEVVINNNAGAKVGTQKTNGPRGPRLEVQIDEMVAAALMSGSKTGDALKTLQRNRMGGR
jgi:hypothetical protein